MTEAFIISWNEIETIHLTIKHYQQFCDQITIYDNYSDDGSDKVAESMGCKVIKFGIKGQLSDAAYLKIKNYCWKNSTADWVIVCDCDEILWHPNLKEILNEKEATIFKTSGYQIFSEEMPKDSYLEIKTGFPDESYSKRVIFNPRRITNICYQYGAHACTPEGIVSYSKEVLYLLHYRNIGGVQRLIDRHAKYRPRMSDDNKRLGLGLHYMIPEQAKKYGHNHDAILTDEQKKERWFQQLEDSRELSELGF